MSNLPSLHSLPYLTIKTIGLNWILMIYLIFNRVSQQYSIRALISPRRRIRAKSLQQIVHHAVRLFFQLELHIAQPNERRRSGVTFLMEAPATKNDVRTTLSKKQHERHMSVCSIPRLLRQLSEPSDLPAYQQPTSHCPLT